MVTGETIVTRHRKDADVSSKSKDHQKDRSQIKGLITRRITRSLKYETIITPAKKKLTGVLDDTESTPVSLKKNEKETKHKVIT